MIPIRRIVTWRALAACLAIFISSCNDKAAEPAVATTGHGSGLVVDAAAGRIEGVAEGSLHVFKGIPYAEPPVGDLRWRPPSPMQHWPDTLKANQFGPACAQPSSRIASVYTRDITPVSEDCLTLNIWAPADAADAPVFVWIHGGALVAGSSKEPFYDGTRLAREGIIVVSINFRLGVFGYLAHPELSAESPLGVSGNYGLLDQIEALRWIRKNISAFGGDPSNVTIAGESSGGLGVMFLMVAPDARGLFSKAIAQSAYMVSWPELKHGRFGVPSAEEFGLQFAAKLQKPDIAALRAMDSQALTDAAVAAGYMIQATIDGQVLPRQLVEVFNDGEQAPVPVLAGFNSGEIRSMPILAPPPPATAADYETIIRERYMDLADEYLRLYPGTDLQESIFANTRDALYGWTAERLAVKQTELGLPSFLYLFDHGYPEADAAGLHAFHASEIPYVFGTPDQTPPLWPKIPNAPLETRLADAMIGYWSSFARSGEPRTANEADWLPYGSSRAYMHFGETPAPSAGLLPGMYDLHEETVCRRWASGRFPWNWNTGIISPQLDPAADGLCPFKLRDESSDASGQSTIKE